MLLKRRLQAFNQFCELPRCSMEWSKSGAIVGNNLDKLKINQGTMRPSIFARFTLSLFQNVLNCLSIAILLHVESPFRLWVMHWAFFSLIWQINIKYRKIIDRARAHNTLQSACVNLFRKGTLAPLIPPSLRFIVKTFIAEHYSQGIHQRWWGVAARPWFCLWRHQHS